jgi:hypothetical protein
MKAMELKINCFEYVYANREIVFTDDLKLTIHVLEGAFHNSKYTFDFFQVVRLCNFLNELQEQPIVVEIEQYDENNLSIELSQFVVSF